VTASSQRRRNNRLFTIFCYGNAMATGVRSFRRFLAVLVMMVGLLGANPTLAQNCSQATTQGTAPTSWETYCWLNFANYNDATARSASGQNLNFTLPDGSVLSLNARVTGGTGTAYSAVTAPTWTGAAIGNSAFIGIPGRPALYTAAAGSRTITLSGITIIPPVGASASVFSFIVADAESSNEGESLRMSTNGGAWQLLDSVPPISGSTLPSITGMGTSNARVTGVGGTVGAYILGSNSPTDVTVETVAGGLQGVMFAVRFASIRLQKAIVGTRINASDQFQYQIVSTGTGAAITGGTTSGSGGGPFSTPALVMSAGLPLTLRETMATGSVSTLAQYSSSLTCVNSSGPTRASLPNNLATTSFNLGQLEFGEALVCTFTNGAQPRLTLRKALGGGGRRFAGDQFTVRIRQGETVVASSTTTGTGGTVSAGNTGAVPLVAGQVYSLEEVAAGNTNLGNYNAAIACTNATSGTGTTLPTALPSSINPRVGDVITCTITNTRRGTAVLVVDKTSTVISDPVNGTSSPKLIPGAIVEYAIRVRNFGSSSVDSSSIVIIDDMPAEMAFVPGTPVTFTNGTPTSGLNAFDAGTMVRYSATGSAGPFTYTPTGAADANVRAIRIAPTGTMAAASSGTSQPTFTIRFRATVQ
jgi:uncharacterized repeat protein (TIGR01451 family)